MTTRTGTSATAWKFTGEQADAHLGACARRGLGGRGYYFLRARYYDTATGRFVGRDKLEFSQRYAYAGNNPALLTDPSGLCVPFCLVLGPAAYWIIGAGAVGFQAWWTCTFNDCAAGARALGNVFAGAADDGRDSNPARPEGEREYSGHARERMGQQGLGEEAVEGAIRRGQAQGNVREGHDEDGRPDAAKREVWDSATGTLVVVDAATGRVINTVDRDKRPGYWPKNRRP